MQSHKSAVELFKQFQKLISQNWRTEKFCLNLLRH